MRRLAPVVMALAAPLAAPVAAAEPVLWIENTSCPVAHRAAVDGLSTVALDTTGVPSRLRAAAERAAAMWNDEACLGEDRFPRFVLDAAADRRLEIIWHAGLSEREPTSCGSFAGREIRLYGRARDPSTGTVGSCGDAARIAETLAHELGHALGLLDQTAPGCGDQIMSYVARTASGAVRPRRVQPAECLAADRKFETAAERRRDRRRGLPLLVATWAGDLPQP